MKLIKQIDYAFAKNVASHLVVDPFIVNLNEIKTIKRSKNLAEEVAKSCIIADLLNVSLVAEFYDIILGIHFHSRVKEFF